MIGFSLRAKTDKYLGTAYCKRDTAYIYLDNLLLNNTDFLTGKIQFRDFIREFWVTYFHEYLHLFFTNKLGKWGGSCATKIDPLAERLMWSMMEREEFEEFAQCWDSILVGNKQIY